MPTLTILENYEDADGNVVIYDGDPITEKISIRFDGRNNEVRIARRALVKELQLHFAGDGGRVRIGSTTKRRAGLRFHIRVGHEAEVRIGPNVGAQSRALVIASEGQKVIIGKDSMLSSSIEIRTDDSHSIYDVKSGARVNPPRSIRIGEHVWLGKHAAVLGGVTIGNGAIVGFRSIVTKDIPNNSIATGAPARVVRRDIAWERPIIAQRLPGVQGLPEGESKSSDYWNLTDDEPALPIASSGTRAGSKLASALRAAIAQFRASMK